MLDRTGLVALDRERAAKVQRDGFIHLENIISENRIPDLLELANMLKPGDNVHQSKIFSVLTEDLRVQQLVQSLFAEPVYYFGYSTVMNEAKAVPAILHDDAKGSPISNDGKIEGYFEAFSRPYNPVKHEPYPVWRLFIYLNDHAKHSGGTKVRRGSWKRHEFFSKVGFRQILRGKFKNVSLPWFGYVNPMVKPGDAVLFNLRTRHSAHFVRLRGLLKNVAMPTALDNIIKSLTLKSKLGRKILNAFAYPFPEKRTSLIIDFCMESDWARGFQANRILSPMNKDYRNQLFDCTNPDFVARLNALGIRVLKAPALPALENFLKSK